MAQQRRPGCLLDPDKAWESKAETRQWILEHGSLHAAVISVMRNVVYDGTPIGEWVKSRAGVRAVRRVQRQARARLNK